jgi:hypothetical protein
LHNRKQPWNPFASKSNEKPESPKESGTCEDLAVPGNSHEFQKYWRKCQKDKAKKYQYLITIGGSMLTKIFKAEISMGLLGEFIDILNENWEEEDFPKIYDILHCLTTVKRFSLSLQFLSHNEKVVLADLFQKLHVGVAGQSEIESKSCVDIDCLRSLEKCYGVTVE